MKTRLSIPSPIRLLVVATLVTVGALAAHADESACQAMLAAKIKLAGVSSHQIMTFASGGKIDSQADVVIAGNRMWMRNGSAAPWQAQPFDAEKNAGDLKAATLHDCRHVRDEAVGGEAAAVFVSKGGADAYSHTSTELWVSKSRGLPLRQTVDNLDDKSTLTILFDYKDVKPRS